MGSSFVNQEQFQEADGLATRSFFKDRRSLEIRGMGIIDTRKNEANMGVGRSGFRSEEASPGMRG